MWDTRKHSTFADFVASQSTEELYSHLESLLDHFARCEESGDGISTKEVAWERGFKIELIKRGERTRLFNLYL